MFWKLETAAKKYLPKTTQKQQQQLKGSNKKLYTETDRAICSMYHSIGLAMYIV
jgi:hypothetical protein